MNFYGSVRMSFILKPEDLFPDFMFPVLWPQRLDCLVVFGCIGSSVVTRYYFMTFVIMPIFLVPKSANFTLDDCTIIHILGYKF